MCRKIPKADLREADTHCTYVKSPVRASVWPPLCSICIKDFHFQMCISPSLNNVAQGWAGLPYSSITCTLFGCTIISILLMILFSVVMWWGWGSREVINCYLPDCTVSRGTSWVGLDVLAGVTSSEIGSKYTESFFCPYRHCTDLYLSCHVCLCAS